MPPVVLVVTLGGQPQVVTLALDALLDQGYPIGELIVVHLSEQNPRYQAALARLSSAFASGAYRERPLRYRPFPVLLGGAPVGDIHSEAATDAVLNTFHQLLQQLKQQGIPVHLCISGGRRMLGILALAAALIHFDYGDRIWHLYSTDAIRVQTHEGAVLHLPPGTAGVRLLPVPVRPWGYLFSALRMPPDADARAVLAAQGAAIDATERARCQLVYDRLTPRRRDVLRAFAEGLTPQQVANKLSIELSTVSSHQTAIYQECQAVWDLQSTTRVDYRWVRDAFAPFFANG
jgi:CRISPR-associated protein Csx14